MPHGETLNPQKRPVTVIIGATSKWQASGANTLLSHGQSLRDEETPIARRWGLGGALGLRFSAAGNFVVLTTRNRANASGLGDAIQQSGGQCLTVEMDVGSAQSVAEAFEEIRQSVGDPDVLIYNAGYMAGRELPVELELMEFFPDDLFEVAIAAACRGPFLVAKQVLPAMRARQRGAIFFFNNQYSLRGRKRSTGESLYYPRTMMRALAQALTEEYSRFGVHVANVVVDGFIDSPGTRALPQFHNRSDLLIDPAGIAETFYFLYAQDPSCWTHEIQLTPASASPSF